jgi:hypothetical protein
MMTKNQYFEKLPYQIVHIYMYEKNLHATKIIQREKQQLIDIYEMLKYCASIREAKRK